MSEETFVYLPTYNENTWRGTHVVVSVSRDKILFNIEFLNHKTWRSRETCVYELNLNKKEWWYALSLPEYGIAKEFEQGLNDIVSLYDGLIKENIKYDEQHCTDMGVITKENINKWIEYSKTC